MKINNQTIYRFLFSIVFLIFLSSCSQSPQEKLVGEWYGKDETGKIASLVLGTDHSAKMIQGNMVLDGSSIGGKVTWELDAKQNPMHLDLVMNLDSGETKRLLFIVRFVGKNKLQARIGKNHSERPVSFSESNDVNQIILVKQ